MRSRAELQLQGMVRPVATRSRQRPARRDRIATSSDGRTWVTALASALPFAEWYVFGCESHASRLMRSNRRVEEVGPASRRKHP